MLHAPQQPSAALLLLLVLGHAGVDTRAQRPSLARPRRRLRHVSPGEMPRPTAAHSLGHDFRPSEGAHGSGNPLHVGMPGDRPEVERVDGFSIHFQLSRPCDMAVVGGSCRNPVGVAVLLHGCLHTASDWFSDSPVQLNQELTVGDSLLSKGFAVVAPDSRDPANHCWPVQGATINGYTDEPRLVAKALQRFLASHGLEELRLIGVGSSTGGTLLSHLAAFYQPTLPFQAIHLVVSQGDPVAWQAMPMGCPTRISFVYMPGDAYTKDLPDVLAALRAKAIPTFARTLR